MIEQRHLGRSGLSVSALGLGCMSMSGVYGGKDDVESTATIRRAYELGVTLFDTAEAYGAGHNEELLGSAVRPFRDRVVIASKFGNPQGSAGEPATVNGRPEYVKQACDASLLRLGVDVIDLYYQHRVHTDIPIEDIVGAMADLVHAGKVRYLGLSEAAVSTIRRAHVVHPIAALQTEYSLWTRDPEHEILATCRELGIGFVAYSPLGRGFLAGALTSSGELAPDDYRRMHPRFEPENFARNLRIVERLREIADGKGCTLPQLVIAWGLAKGADIVPIPGSRRREHLEENLGALQVRLTEGEIAALAEAVPPGAAAGTRYPAQGMQAINR